MDFLKDLKPGDKIKLEETYWNFGKPEVEILEVTMSEGAVLIDSEGKPVKLGINSTYKVHTPIDTKDKETRDE